MKTISSKLLCACIAGCIALLPLFAPARELDTLLKDTDTLLEDATSARDMPIRTLEKQEAGHHGVAHFRGLNKLTAHTETVVATIAKPVYFTTVEITLHDCWQSASDEPFEAKALVELWENRPDFSHSTPAEDGTPSVIARRKLFHGWMFASNPALSGLEHPVYDLRLLRCRD